MDKDYNNSAKAVRHAGRFTGMTTLIRSTPFLATRGLTYLPKQLLDENNVSIESIKESASMGTLSDPLKVIVQTLADRALEELEAARALRPHITRDVALLTLPALASEHYLFRLRKNNFEVFDPAVIEPIGFDPLKLRLWIRWSAWRGVF
uniref:Uncharacterized protein n=2 Tax=Amorphochlora amoebiformis TaxID=1561963 RepID=A0A7S0DL68_9EUKA|mmetsp:Transcript_29412/g.46959  ORF Transcript_29412/g.46959 Transcript_29412/m.46959 type:complete len:150 (+) Transcript_29412:85-534(+)